MTDYHPLIARAVEGLDKSTGEARRALYERARTALVAQLRAVEPALSESEITKERLALEDAIRKVEAEAARKSRRGGTAPGRLRRGASARARPRMQHATEARPRRRERRATIGRAMQARAERAASGARADRPRATARRRPSAAEPGRHQGLPRRRQRRPTVSAARRPSHAIRARHARCIWTGLVAAPCRRAKNPSGLPRTTASSRNSTPKS